MVLEKHHEPENQMRKSMKSLRDDGGKVIDPKASTLRNIPLGVFAEVRGEEALLKAAGIYF